jgi:UDP-2,3-diacylglucosamine pyrophosphatase LpxH
MLKRMTIYLAVVSLTCGCASTVTAVPWTATPSFKAASTPGRTIVVISDLHLGLGKNVDNEWYATEDFRWPKALKAFLTEMSRIGNQQVDLIIAGDFLEMWQRPETIRCEGVGADLGCTVEEMTTLATQITKAHAQVLKDLRDFSQKGENRLHIIPGNHDSALLIAAVWEPVGKALGTESGHVNFVSTGVWISADGSIVIEHGHQIGTEVNRYDTWPDIVRAHGGKEYIIRPWGEQFVQKMFNEQEKKYPIIDNLSPESAGIRYRMADRGAWGTAEDIARFVSFNLFQTSLSQKASILGPGGDSMMIPEDKPKWDLAKARDQGHSLFVAALPENDDLRKALVGDSEQAKQACLALNALAKDKKRLPDENVKLLCEQAEIRGNSLCKTTELGASIEKLLIPREWVLGTYLSDKEVEFPKMRFFIYGHTHLFEEAWQPSIGSSLSVKVLNSGAFHRVIDEEGFLRRVAAKNIAPEQGLGKITVEQLPPCYTFVLVSPGKEPKVWNWAMEESSEAGRCLNPGNEACK